MFQHVVPMCQCFQEIQKSLMYHIEQYPMGEEQSLSLLLVDSRYLCYNACGSYFESSVRNTSLSLCLNKEYCIFLL